MRAAFTSPSAGAADAAGPAGARTGRRLLPVLYTGVSLVGFLVDAGILRLLMSFGLGAAWARAVSLPAAMQVTFLLNGLLVFRCLDRRCALRQWATYMATNAVGNLCNYFVFVTLVSLHHPVVSNRWVALGVSAVAAWIVNYAATRYLVFNPEAAARRAGTAVARLTPRGRSPMRGSAPRP